MWLAVVLSPVVVSRSWLVWDSTGAGNLVCSQANWDGVNGGGSVSIPTADLVETGPAEIRITHSKLSSP